MPLPPSITSRPSATRGGIQRRARNDLTAPGGRVKQMTTRWTHAVALIAVGSLAGFLLLELVMRVATHSLFTFAGINKSDPLLGRLPQPGTTSWCGWRDCVITTGDYGTRLNGNPPPRAERALILAVGDSFTFGEDVGDRDSWPAALERLTDRRVINGGANGFGLDQAVLRAEQLAGVYAPDIIVVSFIPNDVSRCEASYFLGHPKPHFDIDGSALRLYPPPDPPTSLFTPIHRKLRSVSIVANIVFLAFEHSLDWEGPYVEAVHHRGPEVACRLMERLATLGRERKAQVVVLAQQQQADVPPGDLETKAALLACARANQLQTLDLFPVLAAIPADSRRRLFTGHMTPEGNRLVAA